ncbi:ATP-binding protein [Amycolatopsis sp., V23-08]|uniref:ATP-binding protein n=1 Tax=Amycolatopsis heterodermiae TaxID=3110235 RepID=A0ABU5QXS5_9PSEU|nr:ATP-binding protein [Amycolatopsis sp., V23-08]MEA5358740.1 ATP-binding protein [Amycolatopsis sp., V23-08]
MRLLAVEIDNWKSFDHTGRVNIEQINLLVGRNNSGKSAFIRAVHQLQDGLPATLRDLRLQATGAVVGCHVGSRDIQSEIEKYFRISYDEKYFRNPYDIVDGHTQVVFRFTPAGNRLTFETPSMKVGENRYSLSGKISAGEPNNFLYTYFSKRKVVGFSPSVDINRARRVSGDLSNLVAKIDRLANPGYTRSQTYFDLCDAVLGFRVTAYQSEEGKEAGLQIGDYDTIPLEAMGEGVSSLLGLIVDLCMAEGKVFLIEEPENDIHPEGLKKLLNVIVDKSETNQFIISTHSNVVVKHLGAAPNSQILSVRLADYKQDAIPTSTITPIENTPEARIAVLRELGYELFDFDLADGWLLLEESSAQAIIRNYLIPWFVPRLARIQLVSANGVGKVEPAFEDFRRLFLYAHLEKHYEGRAWVVVDGDDLGKKTVQSLRAAYKSWPEDHFQTWSKQDFERFYPARFAPEVQRILVLSHREKREPKRRLLEQVKTWCEVNADEAKREFEESAAEVVDFLRRIDMKLFDG